MIFTPSRICASWFSRSRKHRGTQSLSSSRLRRCITSRRLRPALRAPARTSSPSTASAAARALRPPASAITSASRLNWRSQRWITRLREEGIRDHVSPRCRRQSIRSSADVVKAIALGADAVYIATCGAAGAGLPPVPHLPDGAAATGASPRRVRNWPSA